MGCSLIATDGAGERQIICNNGSSGSRWGPRGKFTLGHVKTGDPRVAFNKVFGNAGVHQTVRIEKVRKLTIGYITPSLLVKLFIGLVIYTTEEYRLWRG